MLGECDLPGLTDMEAFLANHSYLSGADIPGQIDSQMVDFLTTTQTIPDRCQFPKCFAWYWSLAPFAPQARSLWPSSDPHLEAPVPGLGRVFRLDQRRSGLLLLRQSKGSLGLALTREAHGVATGNRESFREVDCADYRRVLQGSALAQDRNSVRGSSGLVQRKTGRPLRHNFTSIDKHKKEDVSEKQGGPKQSRLPSSQFWISQFKTGNENGQVKTLPRSGQLQVVKCRNMPRGVSSKMVVCDLLSESITADAQDMSSGKSQSRWGPAEKPGGGGQPDARGLLRVCKSYSFEYNFGLTSSEREKKNRDEREGTFAVDILRSLDNLWHVNKAQLKQSVLERDTRRPEHKDWKEQQYVDSTITRCT